MKDQKTLNKLITNCTLVCSSLVLIYVIVMGVIAANLWGASGEFTGISIAMYLFAIFSCGGIITKMLFVSIPTLKNNSNRTMAIGALVMDCIALSGIVLLTCAYIIANVNAPSIENKTNIVLSLSLVGAPELFFGNIVSGSFLKSALKANN